MKVALEFDDFGKDNHRLDLLMKLKEYFPNFKVTMFAIPADCPDDWVAGLPDWIELCYHGWLHTPREWEHATAAKARLYIATYADKPRFYRIFRPPYWLLSNEAYAVLKEEGFFFMCLHPDDPRKKDYTYNWNLKDDFSPVLQPADMSGDIIYCGHGHVQNVCDNGLEQVYSRLMGLPKDTEFLFVSEVIKYGEGKPL